MASGCADLCSRHPALETLADAAATIDVSSFPSLTALDHCLTAGGVRNARGTTLRVGDANALPGRGGRAYESRILETGVIAVHPRSWHDVLNVLVWRTFPRAKAALNARHCAVLERHAGAPRGVVRDALTLVDESGVIVAASDASLLDALRGFRWQELFWSRRTELSRCLRVHVFGHAVYEKLLCPYVGLTGHAVLFHVDQAVIEAGAADRFAELDRRLASSLLGDTGGLKAPRDLHPVPLLGIPGWHPDTGREVFYANRDYFRPGRRRRESLNSSAPG